MDDMSMMAFRASDEQRERWHEAAAADGRTLSSWIRVVCDRAAATRELPTSRKPKRRAR